MGLHVCVGGGGVGGVSALLLSYSDPFQYMVFVGISSLNGGSVFQKEFQAMKRQIGL